MAGSLLITASAQAAGWMVQTTPSISGGSDLALNAVSCATGGSCTAVGSYLNANGVQRPLAETWDGHVWTTETVPVQVSQNSRFPTEATLNAVSCTAPDACTAVGSFFNVPNFNGALLVERWNGSGWTMQNAPAPEPDFQSIVFNGVSCISSSSCTAVGDSDTPGGFFALAEHWDGSAWTVQATPQFPPDPGGVTVNYLNSVSCRGANFCMVTGKGGNPKVGSGTLALRWNGTSWAIRPTPDGGGVQEPDGVHQFEGVSCASPQACTAVGIPPLAERWNGTSWAFQSPTFGEVSSLLGVSCPSVSSCVAVGSSGDSSHPATLRAVAESWDGSFWTEQTAPSPYGADQLNGVSCRASGVCTAVGESSRGALVERYTP